MFAELFYSTIRMGCQEENEKNWDGESASVLIQTTLGILMAMTSYSRLIFRCMDAEMDFWGD